MVFRVCDPHGARALGGAGGDGALAVGAEVVGEEQPERAGGGVEDRAGIAAGVVGIVPDDLLRAPRATGVGGAFEEDVDIAGVATGGFAAFGKGEQVAVGRADDGRDAIGVIAVLAGDKDVGLFDSGDRRRERGGEQDRQDEEGTEGRDDGRRPAFRVGP